VDHSLSNTHMISSFNIYRCLLLSVSERERSKGRGGMGSTR
jgi:hypothetical protein